MQSFVWFLKITHKGNLSPKVKKQVYWQRHITWRGLLSTITLKKPIPTSAPAVNTDLPKWEDYAQDQGPRQLSDLVKSLDLGTWWQDAAMEWRGSNSAQSRDRLQWPNRKWSCVLFPCTQTTARCGTSQSPLSREMKDGLEVEVSFQHKGLLLCYCCCCSFFLEVG